MRTGGSQEGRGGRERKEPATNSKQQLYFKKKKSTTPLPARELQRTLHSEMRTSRSLLGSRKTGILPSLALSQVSLESHLCRIYWELSGYFSSPCDPHVTQLCLFKCKHTNWPAAKFVCLLLALAGPVYSTHSAAAALEHRSSTTESKFFTPESIQRA